MLFIVPKSFVVVVDMLRPIGSLNISCPVSPDRKFVLLHEASIRVRDPCNRVLAARYRDVACNTVQKESHKFYTHFSHTLAKWNPRIVKCLTFSPLAKAEDSNNMGDSRVQNHNKELTHEP